ncbi:hypothetical protein IJ818_02745 [bacterium]|nr:hypothetical protein [bacterium]
MENIKKLLPVVLIFILTFSLRIFWVLQKDYLFVDDTVSFVVSSPSSVQDGTLFKKSWEIFNFKHNYEYSAKKLKSLMFYNGGTFNSLKRDLKMMYLYDYDSGHPNLFYVMFRIWTFNLKDISVNSLILYGFTFNLLIFIISFFVMFKLLQLTVREDKFIYTGLFLAFISSSAVSNTLLFREYQLQGLGFIIVSYIFSKIYLWIIENKNLDILSRKNIIIYSAAFSFFFLTGYFSLVYALLLLISLLIVIIKNIGFSRKIFGQISSIILMSIIFTFIADIHYIGETPDYTGSLLYPFTSFELLEKNIYTCFDVLQKTLFYFIVLLYGLFLAVFVKSKPAKNNLILLLSSLALVWSIIALLFAPYFDIRYFLPAVPVLSLIILYFIMKFDFKYAVILCFIYLSGIIFPNVKFNNFDTIRPFLFYVHDHNNFVFKNPLNIPLVFRDYQHTISSFVIYSNDNQKITFVDEIPNKHFKYNEYILFFKKDNIEKYQESIRKLNIVSRGCTKFNDCYVIVKNN